MLQQDSSGSSPPDTRWTSRRHGVVRPQSRLVTWGAVRNHTSWWITQSVSSTPQAPALHFSPDSLQLPAPGWHYYLFASWTLRRGTSVSTSSAAKHFKQCKFNEQQSNSVPEGMALVFCCVFLSPPLFPFVSTGTLTLLSESWSSTRAAVMSRWMRWHIFFCLSDYFRIYWQGACWDFNGMPHRQDIGKKKTKKKQQQKKQKKN